MMENYTSTLPSLQMSNHSSSLPKIDEGDGISVSDFVLAFSVTLVAVVFIILPACYSHIRRRRLRMTPQTTSSFPEDEEQKWERRYYTIESWLVSKKVHGHDSVCDLLMGNGNMLPSPHSEKEDPCNNWEDYDEECGYRNDGDCGRECPVCFEPFKVGEIVSWSPSPKCDHVFHHVCIKEWLRDRKDCPFCREIFLPIDSFEGELPLSKIPDLILGQNLRRVHCFYCIKHEAVFLPTTRQLPLDESIDKDLVTCLVNRASAVPERHELSGIRGIRVVEDEETLTTLAPEEQHRTSHPTCSHTCRHLDIIDDPADNAEACCRVCNIVDPANAVIECGDLTDILSVSEAQQQTCCHPPEMIEDLSDNADIYDAIDILSLSTIMIPEHQGPSLIPDSLSVEEKEDEEEGVCIDELQTCLPVESSETSLVAQGHFIVPDYQDILDISPQCNKLAEDAEVALTTFESEPPSKTANTCHGIEEEILEEVRPLQYDSPSQRDSSKDDENV